MRVFIMSIKVRANDVYFENLLLIKYTAARRRATVRQVTHCAEKAGKINYAGHSGFLCAFHYFIIFEDEPDSEPRPHHPANVSADGVQTTQQYNYCSSVYPKAIVLLSSAFQAYEALN